MREINKRKPNSWIDHPPDYSKMIPSEGLGNMMGLEEIEAVVAVMKEKIYTWGRFVDQFENEFANFLGVKYAYAVSSCTAALEIASKLIGIKPGDEVIVPAITFVSTSLAPLEQGAKIVFADIDPRTYNIDPQDIAKKITKQTKAIYVVHLDGQPADMDPIMKIAKGHGIHVIEDCAHTPGAEYKCKKVGTIGDMGCFSFHALKNMSTLGEGGMIVTNSEKFGEEIPTMRCMGYKSLAGKPRKNGLGGDMFSDVVDIRGKIPSHYRMNDFQAAVGTIQLGKLIKMNQMRAEIFDFYEEELSKIKGITTPYQSSDVKCVNHRYTALYDEKIAGIPKGLLKKEVEDKGVAFGSTYLPLYLWGVYRDRGYKEGLCPTAEEFYKKSLRLPIYPELIKPYQEKVISVIKNSLQRLKGS